MELPELMSVKELRQYLGIGKEKGFPSVRIGGRYYVMKEKFTVWLAKQGRRK